jgi:hypothetical protein
LSSATETFWPWYGYASVAVGTCGRVGGVRFRCWSKIVTPSTWKFSSLKPTPAPNENAASPVSANICVSVPLIGMLMPIDASLTRTSTLPSGIRLNVAVPPTVRIPAALNEIEPVTCWICVAVANGIVMTDPSLKRTWSVTARPLVLILIVRLPLSVRPSRPTKRAPPVAKSANVPSANCAAATWLAVMTSPIAFGLIVPSAFRYGPEPKKISTSVAP